MGDRNIPNPGTTPYYTEDFFAHIRAVKEEGLQNVTSMESKIWYRVLLENNVTHMLDKNGTKSLIPCRPEA